MGSIIELKTGINMGYAETGKATGQTVVMIHGATDSRVSFSQVASLLAEAGYHVLLPELRGHGESDKPDEIYSIPLLSLDIVEFMESITGAAHIIGHSLGSIVAQELAITRPDLVLSLTLIGTTDKLAGNGTLQWLVEGDGDFPGILAFSGNMPDDFLNEWTYSDNEDAAFVKAVFEHAQGLPASTWLNSFCSYEDVDNSMRLKDISMPVQIIWGTDDLIFDKQDQLSLINSLGPVMIRYLQKPGKGHNTHWEKGMAQEIAEDICRFIEDIGIK
jgi:pimeloyl-ACP methyl ester carboxylesterase